MIRAALPQSPVMSIPTDDVKNWSGSLELRFPAGTLDEVVKLEELCMLAAWMKGLYKRQMFRWIVKAIRDEYEIDEKILTRSAVLESDCGLEVEQVESVLLTISAPSLFRPLSSRIAAQ
jgi:hypothetical protein